MSDLLNNQPNQNISEKMKTEQKSEPESNKRLAEVKNIPETVNGFLEIVSLILNKIEHVQIQNDIIIDQKSSSLCGSDFQVQLFPLPIDEGKAKSTSPAEALEDLPRETLIAELRKCREIIKDLQSFNEQLRKYLDKLITKVLDSNPEVFHLK